MQPHQATAITLTACQVLKVSRSSFLSILKESDEDFEKFCMIRDNSKKIYLMR
jgi:CRP-like cAMP-binding protein